MADARRIIWSNYVSPQAQTTKSAVEGTLEEVDLDISSYSKYILDSEVGKSLGGKGDTDITYEQTTQEWTSFAHPSKYWEAYNDSQTDGGSNAGLDDWDSGNTTTAQQGAHYWSDYLTVGSSEISLSSQTDDLKFLYIKNVGSTNSVLLAMDGVTANFDIKISPGAAVCIRGGHGDCNCNVPQVKSASGTDIEFIIAK